MYIYEFKYYVLIVLINYFSDIFEEFLVTEDFIRVLNNTANFGRGGRIRNVVDLANIRSGSTLTFQVPNSVVSQEDQYDYGFSDIDMDLPSTNDVNIQNSSHDIEMDGGISSNDDEVGSGFELEENDRVLDIDNKNDNSKFDLFGIKEEEDEGEVLNEFDDDLCMEIQIQKKSRNNQAFDSMNYAVIVNKIGIDAVVVSDVEVDQQQVVKAIPTVRDKDIGVFVPKYKYKTKGVVTSAILKLIDFIPFKAAASTILNKRYFYVFSKDEKTGSYKFFKVDKEQVGDDLGNCLKEDDLILGVSVELFNKEFGAMVDDSGNIHVNFFNKEVKISSGQVWDGIRNAACYVSNKIFSLFRKKKELEFGNRNIKYIKNKNKIYYLY